jgi:hypothetical protein
MNILDVEIYIKQFIDFFEKNPNDLIDLIGDSLKEEFYSEAKEQSTKNYNDGNDVTLTRQQLIDIVVKLKKTHQNNTSEKVINKIFQNTKYGLIYLN